VAFRYRVLSQGSNQSQQISPDFIFILELPGFGFHEAIFRLYVLTRTKGSLLVLVKTWSLKMAS
jgi:hypothetical protein